MWFSSSFIMLGQNTNYSQFLSTVLPHIDIQNDIFVVILAENQFQIHKKGIKIFIGNPKFSQMPLEW